MLSGAVNFISYFECSIVLPSFLFSYKGFPAQWFHFPGDLVNCQKSKLLIRTFVGVFTTNPK